MQPLSPSSGRRPAKTNDGQPSRHDQEHQAEQSDSIALRRLDGRGRPGRRGPRLLPGSRSRDRVEARGRARRAEERRAGDALERRGARACSTETPSRFGSERDKRLSPAGDVRAADGRDRLSIDVDGRGVDRVGRCCARRGCGRAERGRDRDDCRLTGRSHGSERW